MNKKVHYLLLKTPTRNRSRDSFTLQGPQKMRTVLKIKGDIFMTSNRFWTSIALLSLLCVRAHAQSTESPSLSSLERGLRAINRMTGCYLVDYSYTETESLKEGYGRDNRVYDVSKDKTNKEWIFAEEISPERVRLQHILFAADLQGRVSETTLLKHQVEEWEYGAKFLYEFTEPSTWQVKALAPDLWTRKITNLDDGLRYQCAANWNENTAYPEWSCDNYAPIPGRETRDMGRKDYNTLQRSTRIVIAGNNWLERQDNIKTIHKDGVKTPLAREVGKNWYVRLPSSECDVARSFARPRRAFWDLLRELWDEILIGDRAFVEKPGIPPRFTKVWQVGDQYTAKDLSDPAKRAEAKAKILKIIADYRAN